MVNTNTLLNNVKSAVFEELIDSCTYIGVGTGIITATASDTALYGEVLRKERQEYTRLSDSIIFSMWIGTSEANGYDLAEVGIYNGSGTASLLTRNTFNTLSKTSDIELWIDIEEDIDVSQ